MLVILGNIFIYLNEELEMSSFSLNMYFKLFG